MSEVVEFVKAVLASRSFTRFFSGESTSLPGHGPISLKVKSVRPFTRSEGYRLVKHSICTIVETESGLLGYGYGESDFELLALQKSIAEGVERCIFRTAKQADPSILTSNGWAAHLTQKKARQSAMVELLERDTSLVHWLSETSYTEILSDSWPEKLKYWADDELSRAPKFNKLRILVSHLGHVSTAATVIHDTSGFAFVSQACSNSLSSAVSKALAETCRIADLSSRVTGSTSTNLEAQSWSPEEHIAFYAKKEPLPEWLYGKKATFQLADSLWRSPDFRKTTELNVGFSDYHCGPLFVAHASSPDLQSLFFGTTDQAVSNGWINSERVKSFCGNRGVSPLPHFVP